MLHELFGIFLLTIVVVQILWPFTIKLHLRTFRAIFKSVLHLVLFLWNSLANVRSKVLFQNFRTYFKHTKRLFYLSECKFYATNICNMKNEIVSCLYMCCET